MSKIRRLNKAADQFVRHPLTWLLATVVLAAIGAQFYGRHLESEAFQYRQMSALIKLMHQPGGATFPATMSNGVEMFADTPKPLFDQLFSDPVDMCKMLGCEAAFGSPLDAQSIVTIATAVRDSRLQEEATNNASWANALAWLSLAISLLTFALTALRPMFIPINGDDGKRS